MSRPAGHGGTTANGCASSWSPARSVRVRAGEDCRVRQDETAPKGAWTGATVGGVKAPAPIVLPDPGLRFSRSAERLERLAEDHAAEGWLAFMAEVARAQAGAATALPPPTAPD